VHFDAIWWQLFVGRRTRFICNFAIKTEPICQLQCPHDCTAVLPLLRNEHALKSGTFGVPRLVLLGRGTTLHKSGASWEIRDGWQPYAEPTQNAPVWWSGRLNSHCHNRHDKTVQSVSCLAWRCELGITAVHTTEYARSTKPRSHRVNWVRFTKHFTTILPLSYDRLTTDV